MVELAHIINLLDKVFQEMANSKDKLILQFSQKSEID